MTRPTNEILREAARVLAKQDKLRKEQRALDTRVRELCREFEMAERCWGLAPHMLRQEVETRTNRKIAA
jgi:hypothetical protein